MNKKGIYVHIPFCIKKCAYCSFNSYSDLFYLADEYSDAVLREIKSADRCSVDTVYFGGGTPSAICEKYILKILDAIYEKFDVSKDAEITIEVNPKTADEKKLSAYKNAGINRLSIGAQDFFDENLKKLGRIHSVSDTFETVDAARKAGFDNISLDIMYGFENQTIKDLEKTLETAMNLNPSHISVYALSVEEGTPVFERMKKGENVCVSDEVYANMYDDICEKLSKHGYEKYELSNFAKDKKYSRHNMSYWECKEYYGFGAGASGYVKNTRYKNVCEISDYIKNPFEKCEKDILSKEDMMKEFVILGLRLTKGISKKKFFEKFGADIYDVFGKSLNKHIKNTKLLCENDDKIYLSKDASFVSNAVFVDFI